MNIKIGSPDPVSLTWLFMHLIELIQVKLVVSHFFYWMKRLSTTKVKTLFEDYTYLSKA